MASTMRVSRIERKSFATLVDPWKEKNRAGEVPWARALSLNQPKYPNVDLCGDVVLFGRKPECQVKIDNPTISGLHCKLIREDEQKEEEEGGGFNKVIWLEDCSTNGTFVGHDKVGKGNRTRLVSGTQFTLIPAGTDRDQVAYILYVNDEKDLEKAPIGQVVFVFTDVQNSTDLWGRDSEAMNASLFIHDAIMRELLKRFRGYEVKTEGDAFMVTFFCAMDALRWCLAVQKALLVVEWPANLTVLPFADKVSDAAGKPIFNGLRVRMGIHIGPPICRRNPTTKRMDYYGPTVNMSARVSDTAHGGQIVCTQTILDSLASETKALERRTLRPEAKASASAAHGAAAGATPASARIATALAHTMVTSVSPSLVPDFSPTMMGTFPLKGLTAPVTIYQLTARDLVTRKFPPLRVDVPDEEPAHAEADETPAVDAGAVLVAGAPAVPPTPAPAGATAGAGGGAGAGATAGAGASAAAHPPTPSAAAAAPPAESPAT